jgi:hypothetical protein
VAIKKYVFRALAHNLRYNKSLIVVQGMKVMRRNDALYLHKSW